LVEIRNYRGKSTIQINILRDCYKKNYIIYDWFIMVDMDEFIFLKDFKNIKSYLKGKRFMKCNLIHLNWVFHTDNNQIYYKNKSLFERFPNYKPKLIKIKSILRGHIINIKINSIHGINKKDNFTDFKYHYFDHFYCKSTEEFIEKLNRGDAYFVMNKKLKFKKIQFYFTDNQITIEKIRLFEKKTGIKMDYFKNIISKKENDKKNEFKKKINMK